MKLVSIRKYLDRAGPEPGAAAPLACRAFCEGPLSLARDQAESLQEVFTLFQEALLSLAGRGERNVGRLEQIQ